MSRSLILVSLLAVVALSCTKMKTTTGLNFRVGPGTSYSVSRTLAANAEICVESVSNGWAKTSDGLYCSSKYLKEVETTSTGSTAASCTKKYTTADYLRVRSGPGTSYSTVKTVSKGTEVCVISTTGDWAKLEGNYYVSSAYLTATKPSTSTGSTTTSTTGDKRKCAAYWNKYSSTRYPTREEFVSAWKSLAAGDTINYTQSSSRWYGISKAVCPPSLPTYADCSSFVTWAFWTAFGGLSDTLNKASWGSGNTGTLAKYGTKISSTTSGCSAGDLLMYTGHVAIYAGSNKVINFGSQGPIKHITYSFKTPTGCYRYDVPFGQSF